MGELLEFLIDKCLKGLTEAKVVDAQLKGELEIIETLLKDRAKDIPWPENTKDVLHNLIYMLTDITTPTPHKNPAQILCFPCQIFSGRQTRRNLQEIRTQLDGNKEEGGPSETSSWPRICKILPRLKRSLGQGTNERSPNQNGGLASSKSAAGGNQANSLNSKGKEVSSELKGLPEIKEKNILGLIEKIDRRLDLKNRRDYVEIGLLEVCGSGKTRTQLENLGLSEKSTDKSRDGKNEEGDPSETLQRLKRSLEIEDKNILGFDSLIKKINGRLDFNNRSGHVEIGILGMCGSGKTTLAYQIFSHSNVAKGFEPRIWVTLLHVSEQRNFGEILRFILTTCDGSRSDLDKYGKRQLLRMVRENLLGKNYLLVLDGLRDADIEWYFELSKALDWQYKYGDLGDDQSKSAVIVTTRQEAAAKTMVGISGLHHIHSLLLHEDTCWSIFIKNLESQKEDIPMKGIVELGSQEIRDAQEVIDKLRDEIEQDDELKKEIKKQCDGLPLAAFTLAEIIPRLIQQQSDTLPAATRQQQQQASSNMPPATHSHHQQPSLQAT